MLVFNLIYFLNTTNLYEIPQYDPDARMIVVDVEKPKGNPADLPRMAYYMEKDVGWIYF